MFFRHSIDKLIYPVLAAAVLLLIGYRPQYRLTDEMPKEFYSEPDAGQATSTARKIAWAYWESAQMDIQWKYPRGSTLPAEPPAEFRIDAKALGPAATDPAIRMQYWHRLQLVWYLPDTWKEEYEWGWSGVGNPITAASQWVRDRFDRLFTIH